MSTHHPSCQSQPLSHVFRPEKMVNINTKIEDKQLRLRDMYI